nr:DUF2599 domain-containing protein [Streptomyces sp. NBC_00974]
MRKTRLRKILSTVAASTFLLLGLQGVGATSASAETFPGCGSYSVDGAIWTEYTQTPGMRDTMGCPTSGELRNPDNIGVRQNFERGAIYWSPGTGAHAVHGLIKDHWGRNGWETGYMGYPLTDEIRNPDGRGVRQQFQNATTYWSPTTGAHAVHGNIGTWWAMYGNETGWFGYPTSDEFGADRIGGGELYNKGVKQNFENYRFITWSDPQGTSGFPECANACIGYGGWGGTKWVNKAEIYAQWSDVSISAVHVSPRPNAFRSWTSNDTAINDMAGLWKEVWDTTFPWPARTQSQTNSVYEQLYCHAKYSFPDVNGNHAGGESWDLETWRPDIGMNEDKMGRTGCNWDS